MNWLYVFIGGGLGSVARYAISLAIKRANWVSQFPWATVIANALACLLFAYIFKYLSIQKPEANSWMRLLLLTGFCGGFSTFSTFSFENFTLYKQEEYTLLLLNVLISLVLGFLAFLAIAKNSL